MQACLTRPVNGFLDDSPFAVTIPSLLWNFRESAEVGDGGPKVQAGRKELIMEFFLRCDQGEQQATLCVSTGEPLFAFG